jgi:alkylated DNA repair dioxygenase AlkB
MEHRLGFLTQAEGDALYAEVFVAVDWRPGYYSFGNGKGAAKVTQATPRLLGAMKAPGVSAPTYTITDFTSWTPLMLVLKQRLEDHTGQTFAYAQLNLYRDGNDNIGWHSDREVLPGDSIVSLSLGAARQFCLRLKADHKAKKKITLHHGDLLIMDYATATRDYEHTVPKDKRPVGPRISITFRNR